VKRDGPSPKKEDGRREGPFKRARPSQKPIKTTMETIILAKKDDTQIKITE